MILLNRSKSIELAASVVSIAEPLLQEVIDTAVVLLERTLRDVAETDEETFDSRIGVISSYRHLIEMVDGVQLLLSSAAPIPSRLPLRSGLESLLTIEYILADDSRRRAFAWVVCGLHQQARLVEMFDPETNRGRDFLTDFKSDRLVGRWTPTARDSKDDLSKIQSRLKKPHLIEAADEYEGLRSGTGKSKPRIPEWYSFYGGPRNLREVASLVRL